MKPRPMTYFLSLGLALALGIPAAKAETVAPSVLVATASVSIQTVTETLGAFGVLDPDPDQVLSLSLPHAGLINRVWIRLGQRVNSGDKLLEVITAPDARMQYLQAQSSVDYARQEMDRLQRLMSEQLATTAEVDAAKKNLNDAIVALKALQQRGQDVAQETVRAPMDGIITQLDVSQGQRVQADTAAMLIAAEQKLIARLGVEPEDLDKVRTGTAVTITSVFVPSVKIETTIREVHAMINPSTHLVEVLAAIPAAQIDHLVLGSRILGTIVLSSRDAMVVPRSAVLGAGADAHLYLLNNGEARKIPVITGRDAGDLVEVSGELKAGDRVIVSGNYRLSDGMAIRETP